MSAPCPRQRGIELSTSAVDSEWTCLNFIKQKTISIISFTKILFWGSIFLLLFLPQSYGKGTQQSEIEVIVNYSDIKTSSLLDSVNRKYNINFSYNAELPFVNNRKTINYKGNLEGFLSLITKDEEVGFNLVGDQVVFFQIIQPVYNEPIKASLPEFIIIEGTVIDNESKGTLPFASISIKNKSINTVANNKGAFSIKLPIACLNDTLLFSCIGFQSNSYVIQSIENKSIEIGLEEEAIAIKPVIVKPVAALNIVKEMRDAIHDNYSSKNAMCIGFYRETTRDETDYITICEAVLDIAKSPYQSSFLNDQARIFKGRKSEDVKRLKNLSYKLEGGVNNCLMLDVVNEFPSFLEQDYFDFYEYYYVRSVSMDGKELYVIAFDQKASVQSPLFKGEIFIDKESKALVSVKFQLSPRGMKYVNNLFVKKQPRKMKIKTLGVNYSVSYRNFNGKYYLEYVRSELVIKAKSDRLFVNTVFTTVSELVITDIDVNNTARFRKSETTRPNQVLEDIITNSDDSFWGSYNTIKPDEPLIEAIKKLKK